MNTRHPLIIDADPSDIRVVASGLELHNRAQMDKAVRHNRANKARRQAESQRQLRNVADVGAELVQRLNRSTRTVRAAEVAEHYQLTEA